MDVKKKFLLGLGLMAFILNGGCPHQLNFIGMTKPEVAAKLEDAPRQKNGKFRVCYQVSSVPQHTLVNHYHQDKESLLNDPNAMSASQWQVFYHLDSDSKWHSYLLDFENNVVIKQQDRKQPHWVMAEE